MPHSPDPLAVMEAACLAALAEIARQRSGGSPDLGPPPQRRKRSPAMRVVPTSDVCREAAKAALIDLGRAGLIGRRNA